MTLVAAVWRRGDTIELYVHNGGSEQMEITLVEVAGMIHFPDSSCGPGSFMVLGQSGMIDAGSTQVVAVTYGGPGVQDGTIVTVVKESGNIVSSVPIIIGEMTT